MPPTPLDGKPLPLDSADRPPRRTSPTGSPPPDNPYFAKALVNRVWRNFMGRGLVEAEDDLRETNPPSNRGTARRPGRRTSSKNKYDVKHLMRTIMNSAAYQRSSKPLPANAADDRFYSRYLVRRLPAEVILDAYSDVTGVPTPFNQIKSAAGDAATPIDDLPARHAGDAAARLAARCRGSSTPSAGPSASQTCSCERTADASVEPGAAPEQRPDAQRQAARQELRGGEVAGGEG